MFSGKLTSVRKHDIFTLRQDRAARCTVSKTRTKSYKGFGFGILINICFLIIIEQPKSVDGGASGLVCGERDSRPCSLSSLVREVRV